MRQLTPERFELIWRAPTYFRKPHPAKLSLPENWLLVTDPSVQQLADAAPCTAISSMFPPIHSRVRSSDLSDSNRRSPTSSCASAGLDGSETTAIARPGQPWAEVVVQPGAWRVAWDYTLLGIEHILSGFDHLAFVLALLLIVRGARRLLITVTSFTLAHSVTLAAATLGLVWVPGPPVEAVIALSILFLAAEMVKVNRGQPGMTARYPWIVAFAFGLLHGFGFAGALNGRWTAAGRGAAGTADVQRRG